MALPTGLRRNPVVHGLANLLGQVIFPRLPDDEDKEHEPEGHFQLRVKRVLSYVCRWDWNPEQLKYLEIPESFIRDCSQVSKITECK